MKCDPARISIMDWSCQYIQHHFCPILVSSMIKKTDRHLPGTKKETHFFDMDYTCKEG